MTTPVETFFTVVRSALQEVGRQDLADEVEAWDDCNDFGPYLEVPDVILNEDDWTLVTKAETLGRAAVRLPPVVRPIPESYTSITIVIRSASIEVEQ